MSDEGQKNCPKILTKTEASWPVILVAVLINIHVEHLHTKVLLLVQQADYLVYFLQGCFLFVCKRWVELFF